MRPRFITLLAVAATMATGGLLRAQEAQTVKVDIKEVKPGAAQTPQFQVTGSTDKRWRPKNWLEVDMAMDCKKAKTAGDTSTLIDSLEIKFFIGLNAMDASKKYIVLTGTFNVLNIPTKPGEHPHVLAYVSPSTLHRLLGEKQFTQADIKAVAVEVRHGGQLIGGFPVGQGKWWDDLSKYSVVDGAVLPKVKTPFAPLWGDYDLEVKL